MELCGSVRTSNEAFGIPIPIDDATGIGVGSKREVCDIEVFAFALALLRTDQGTADLAHLLIIQANRT